MSFLSGATLGRTQAEKGGILPFSLSSFLSLQRAGQREGLTVIVDEEVGGQYLDVRAIHSFDRTRQNSWVCVLACSGDSLGWLPDGGGVPGLGVASPSLVQEGHSGRRSGGGEGVPKKYKC